MTTPAIPPTALRLLLATAVACTAVLLAPLGAEAATRYASPTGTGPEPGTQADPCALTTATSGGLAAGDTVILLGRTTGASTSLYDLTKLPGRTGIEISRANVTLTALEDLVTIRSNSTSAAVRALAGGVAIRRLVIQNVCGADRPTDPDPAGCTTGALTYALQASSATIDRVFAYASERRACELFGSTTVANTVCLAYKGGYAITITRPGTTTLVNVTARSKFYPAVLIENAGAGGAAGAVTIANSIISAQATFSAPLWANRDDIASPCPLDLALRASSLSGRDVGMSVALTETAMVNEAPTYADVFNLVPKATSPTVNRGSTNPADLALAGAFDLVSRERVQGGRIDLGAYEYAEGVVAPQIPGTPGSGTAAGGAAGSAGGAAPITVARTRALVRPRALNIRGTVIATGAGTATRIVARVQGKRRITICRVTRRLTTGTADLRCATRPAVRKLLRRRALVLVVTTRFTPAGSRAAIVDRQTLRLRRR
ncbi:MAG: hypothetical protein ACO3KD_04365 [Gaiellales bacterium]